MRYLSFQDVLLEPSYSELAHRDEADVSFSILGRSFNLPVVPANMESVIDFKIAKYLSENNYFYIFHRFGINEQQESITHELTYKANREDWRFISISVGVSAMDRLLIDNFKKNNQRIDCITIDVAHGHHLLVKEQIKFIKGLFPDVFLLVGNIATAKAYKDLLDWGADGVKVGVGQGSICTTRLQTGFSVPMFSCVNNIRKAQIIEGWKEIPIISDGGIQHIGDISKAIVAGADAVMCGGLFAGCSDSPAKINPLDGKKIYFGSTSFEAKGHRKYIEGRRLEVLVDVSYEQKLREITEGLQSAVSYSGGKSLLDLKRASWFEGK